MKHKPKLLLTLIGILTLALSVTWSGAFAQDTPQELVIGHPALPTGLDPVMDGTLTAASTYLLIFDRLIDVDATGALVPSIAVSWEALDETTWEFKIREGVTFQNGEALDADDVVFSLNHAAFDAEVSNYTEQFGDQFVTVEAVDPTTVHITTKTPWALLPSRLVLIRVLPKDYFETVGGAAQFSEAPIGSGPYHVTDWKVDNYVQLERFDEYWRGASGPEKVTVRYLGEQSSRVTALEAGEIDVATIIDPEQATRLQNAGFGVINQPIGQLYIYFFRPTLGGPIADQRVRLAINLAVDVQGIIDSLLSGTTMALQGQPAAPGIDGFDPNIQVYGYDPERAKQLLIEAGYPDGFTLTLDTTSGRAPKDQETAEIIAAMLAEVGITVNVNVNEWGVYLDKLFNANMGDMWSLSLNAAPSMTLENPSYNFTSFTGHKSQSDPAYDELQARWAQAFDPAERSALAAEMLQYIHDQAWGLFLWQVPGIHVAAPNVEGFHVGADYKFDLSNVVVSADS